ncbi:U6 snRNA-associated Sm-like protein LSm4 [Babesia ovis]|uniref:U6 snRNA-associated Sm-like protein LSm4 n=1 Tax=Babesia ovis TaxID=5869 RepID=A0A9W5TDL3_BABOV|nr:U6 snRNA-associated Sm-like protein LSm4 [Babesia ovis]
MTSSTGELIELKSGETYSGILSSCDAFMNVHMINAICTSKKGDEFWKLNECFIRGNSVKSFRFPDEVAAVALEESKAMAKPSAFNARGRDRGSNRGRRPNAGRGQMKN